MKVLHVCTTINRGGAENHLRDLISGQIAECGLKVACAYLKGDSYWAEYLRNIGCEVFPLGLHRYGDLGPALRLRQIISKFSPDIVHAHLAPAELYARLALLGNHRTPLIISRHNHNRFYSGPGANVVERWVVSRAARFIGISESVKRHFCSLMPDLDARFEVIPYGIDPSTMTNVSPIEISKLRSEWGVDQNTTLIGTVARLVPIKALHVLLEGYALLCATDSSLDVKLVVVGAGPLESDLKRRAAELDLEGRVVWAGFRQDIPVVMNALDIFVLTSLSEGFGLVLIEAMSASKPVISTNVSALPEIVIESGTGFMVPPEDATSLSVAMQKLAGNASLRQELGSAGYLRASSNFSLATMYRKTMDLYGSVLQTGLMRRQ